MDDYQRFYESHRDKLFSYLLRMTGDYYLAADIVQEGFVRYLEHYGRDEPVTALLYRIARNALWDHYRREKRRAHRNPAPDNPGASPEETLLVREEYRRVLAGMAALADDEREILSLVLTEELDYRDIGELMEMTVANVKVKVHRARRKLRDFLAQGEN